MTGAEDLGKRLLGQVEETGLDEILQILRFEHAASSPTTGHFNFRPLDRLIEAGNGDKPQASHWKTAAQIIELASIDPGGGKTHFLYHLIALAVLPTHCAGNQACAVIIDADDNFSIPRLATQLRLHLVRNAKADDDISEAAINADIYNALRHVHVLRPQTLGSLLATLDSLPAYLFDKTRQLSFDRKVAFLAIDSASAFYWQDRAETEDAAFLASTTTASVHPKKPQSAYYTLSTSLRAACKAFACPAIITTWHLGPPPSAPTTYQEQRSLRPSLPGLVPTLRLVVRRLPVRKFPPGISIEQAMREAGDRLKAVEEGKFECFVNEWGVDERTLRKLQSAGSVFGFRIRNEGLTVDEE